MSKLKAFLQPVVTDRTEEVIVSDRFKDDKGDVVPFVVKCISQNENEKISKKSMVSIGSGKNARKELDHALYARRMIVECTVEPDFRDKEMCDYYGVIDPLDIPGLMLTVGEYGILSTAIMQINDLIDAQEKLDEAKNS